MSIVRWLETSDKNNNSEKINFESADPSIRPNDPLFVDDKLDVLSEGEATYCLREAYKSVLGQYPNLNSLAILWAQSALETGKFKAGMHVGNWGNIRKLSDGYTHYTAFKCNEYIAGKLVWFYPYSTGSFFAAWLTSLDGCVAYLKFLSSKKLYAAAWKQVIAGDASAYCQALKMAGYYTALESDYEKGVVSLCNEFKSKSAKLLAWLPAPTPIIIPGAPPVIDPIIIPPSIQPTSLPIPQTNIVVDAIFRIFSLIKGLFSK